MVDVNLIRGDTLRLFRIFPERGTIKLFEQRVIQRGFSTMPAIIGVFGTHLYSFGGFESEVSDEVSSYHVARNEWKYDLPRLNVARKLSCPCHLGAFLYVACGSDKYGDCLSSIEKLEIVPRSGSPQPQWVLI